jgi:mRNA interferase HicA
MKYSEFRRWLLDRGAVFRPGRGSHMKVTLNGKSTVFPFHGAKEIGTGLVAKIKRDLSIKD